MSALVTLLPSQEDMLHEAVARVCRGVSGDASRLARQYAPSIKEDMCPVTSIGPNDHFGEHLYRIYNFKRASAS